MRTRIDAIVDLIVERVVDVNEPIPREAAKNLLALFQGAATRIQIAADTWMLNGKIDDIYKTEKALLSGTPITAEALFDAVQTLNEMDGGVPFGFQRPLEPGDKRMVWGKGWVEYGQLSPDVASAALIKTDESPIAVVRRDSVISILQQSKPAETAVARIEEKIAGLVPGSPEYLECVDTFRSYSTTMLYDSHKLWQSNGMLDRLIEASIVAGTQEHREAALDFMYNGIERVRETLHKDFGQAEIGCRTLYIAVQNLVLSRQSWDSATLDFVIDKLKWLQTLDSPNDLQPTVAASQFDEILEMRRSERIDPEAIKEVFEKSDSKLKRVNYGAYSVTIAVKSETSAGDIGKVLEISNINTDLKDDTEFYEVLRKLENLAVEHEFTALQLVEWSNIHQARVFRGSGDYTEVTTQREVGQHGHIVEEPTFIKSLSRAEEFRTFVPRPTFEQYLASQFQQCQTLDLSAESSLLSEEAHRYKQQHGGKCMGQVLLRQLLLEFGDSRLKPVPYINTTATDVKNGLTLPQTILNYEFQASALIARSNAAFEYGCPPGILDSMGQIPIPTDNYISVDCQQMESAFGRVVFNYNLDPRTSFHVLLQPQLSPRASGIIYSSFSGAREEPAIVEASLGSGVSATVGLPNLIHYRVNGSDIESYRNFQGETPGVIFHGESCYIDPIECDPSRREVNLYKTVTSDLQALTGKELARIWEEHTFALDSEPHSPLQREELELLSRFAKFAEQKLGKPLKLEFGIADDGSIYLLQLDPAMLEVSNSSVNIEAREGELVLETPFVNMPLNADGLNVVLETPSAYGTKAGEEPFLFVSEVVPLNINIQSDLARPYPQCAGILAAGGSRMNHCYSDARTFIPFVGCVGLSDQLREKFPDLTWGLNPGIKVDIRCDGRRALARFYREAQAE